MAHHPTWPTFAQELLEARVRLTIADEVGLALRAHRRRLRLSQRAYAALRGYSRATLGRLECSAGAQRLDDIVQALEGTGFALYLGRSPAPPRSDDSALSAPEPPPGRTTSVSEVVPAADAPPPVRRDEWPRTELIARVRGGGRRFPGHLEATQVTSPPTWWWVHEFFSGPTPKPLWYSPRPVTMPNGTLLYLLSADGAEHPAGETGEAGPVVLKGPEDPVGPTSGDGPAPSTSGERPAAISSEERPAAPTDGEQCAGEDGGDRRAEETGREAA